MSIPTPKDALNEYFKLKSKFEDDININKKKISNHSASKKEKRSEFLKLMPKCVNCRRPSKKGTIFSTIYYPETETTGAYRKLSASCGNIVDPCNLNIEIHLGQTEQLDYLISNMKKEIKTYKDKIINDKNKLLFGLITTETALDNFDFNKNYINDLTSVYEMYLDQWNKLIENPDKKLELDESHIILYENIHKIKDCIKQMNQNDNNKFASDAAEIYVTTVKPILDKIRHLKYNENIVYHDDYDNKCKLIQRPYTNLDLGVSAYPDKVVHYDVGLQVINVQKNNPQRVPTVESVEEEESPIMIRVQSPSLPLHPSTNQSSKPLTNQSTIQRDEPIVGKDGIEWSVPEYKQLWRELPDSLKNEFVLNIVWMKEFMHKCVIDRKNNIECKLTTPPNLILPPKMTNNQYDFGIALYNKVFNAQPSTLQNTYLTYYTENPTTKAKDYSKLEDALNKLVQDEMTKEGDVLLFE